MSDLFEGITIMSPDEMEQNQTEVSDTTEEVEENEQELEKDKDIEEQANKNSFSIDTISTENSGEIDNLEISETNETSDNEEASDNKEASLNKYGALIKELQEEGIISAGEGDDLEEKLKTASTDTIKELMKTTVEEGLKKKEEEWKKSFSGSKKRFLEIEEAFDDTDHAILTAQRLEYLESIDSDSIADNKELQKQLYAEELKAKNFTKEEILEAIEEADAIDKLEDKAKKALPKIIESTNATVQEFKASKEQRMQEAAEKNKEAFNSLVENLEKKEFFIDGLKLNENVKEKIKENITVPVHKDENGKEYTSLMYKQKRNPSEFQMLISYYDSLGLFNLDEKGSFKPDISKLKNVAKTKAISELDRVLSREEEQGTGRGNSYESDKGGKILNMLEAAMGSNKRK